MSVDAANAIIPVFPADAHVLATRPLRPGIELAETSRFGDEIWALSPAEHQVHLRSVNLHFPKLPAPFVQVTKELFYLLLTEQAGFGWDNIKNPRTIYAHFGAVKEFLLWLEKRDICSLLEVSAQVCIDYRRYLVKRGYHEERCDAKCRSVRLFWLARAQLASGRLNFDPVALWTEETDAGILPARRTTRGENQTQRIPEQVHAPLLVWAMRWIDVFSEDILGAYAEWGTLSVHTPTNRMRQMRRHQRQKPVRDVDARLAALLERYRKAGRPLPAINGVVNPGQLGREIGCSNRIVIAGPRRALVDAAAAELGTAEGSMLWTRMTALLDGELWIPSIGYEQVETMVRLLQTACYIVIAFLSGMRDSEVKHLRRGCLTVWRDNTGRIVRHRVDGLAFKNEQDPVGVPASWVVTAPAARAIAVLERIHPPSQDWLFALPRVSRKYHVERTTGAKTNTQTLKDLVEFTRWISAYCTERDRADGIPLVNGQEWKVITRQFRRTLAWFIARKPGGVIAGAIQYRHVRVQMFEGYAGTSDSGFRAEVEAEEIIARGEMLGDIVTDHAHHRLTGPSAEEAEARLEEFERTARFDGKIITDRKRLERYMAKHDPHIYPGKYVTCSDNPDRRLCWREDGHNGPSLGDCVPLRCRNVALTAANRAHWREWKARMEVEAARREILAPFYRARLEDKLCEVTEFLAANDPDGGQRDASG